MATLRLYCPPLEEELGYRNIGKHPNSKGETIFILRCIFSVLLVLSLLYHHFFNMLNILEIIFWKRRNNFVKIDKGVRFCLKYINTICFCLFGVFVFFFPPFSQNTFSGRHEIYNFARGLAGKHNYDFSFPFRRAE